MEMKANEAFDIYRDLYYEGGVSSVYFWNLDDGFAGVVLLKKCEFLDPFWCGFWDGERLTSCSIYTGWLDGRRMGFHPCV